MTVEFFKCGAIRFDPQNGLWGKRKAGTGPGVGLLPSAFKVQLFKLQRIEKKRGEGIRVPAYHHSSEIKSSRITTRFHQFTMRFHQITNRHVSSISPLLESKHHEAVNPLPRLLPPLNFSPSVIAIRYCYNLHEPSEIPRPIVHSCPIGHR
ncbi:hypothetical protein E3N88_33410 [Mikania micrantha]|uniref:Uncharacterized protein n=1 Tax=Mikania micrantha TaxID=192012 RepID=A0A5N6MB72_9ASTR|nr:hypothetical protein E3N88_33410 [Mikania micrantha]